MKVGIISCSGEELPEGTVSRLAALKVLEELRPGETVTICLPLFLAGGEGDRAFAKFYPTIAIDGCDKRCAYRATEKYSNTPAAGIVVSNLIKEQGLQEPLPDNRLLQIFVPRSRFSFFASQIPSVPLHWISLQFCADLQVPREIKSRTNYEVCPESGLFG